MGGVLVFWWKRDEIWSSMLVRSYEPAPHVDDGCMALRKYLEYAMGFATALSSLLLGMRGEERSGEMHACVLCDVM